MGTGHSHLLFRHGDSLVHRLPAHAKVLAMLGFVLVVVATPRDARWSVRRIRRAARRRGGGRDGRPGS